MKSNIFIPEKINVGFQNREDTYTKKLAYIIYFDEKGVLRKAASWNSWRDKKIDNVIVENVPTSGFVLNKKAGGYSTGWNHRQTYVRVYDPRDFEFEITIPNLLYILENTNSIKGKGLDGEFVYGWDGKDLILIPTSSPDYVEISELNKLRHEKNYVKAKDLIIGATYKSKDNENWIYMGRFDLLSTNSERVLVKEVTGYWGKNEYKYVKNKINKGKHYFFVQESEHNYYGQQYINLLTLKSLGDKFIDTVSNECVENYADLFDRLERRTEYSHYDETKDEYVKFTYGEFVEYINEKNLGSNHWNRSVTLKLNDNENVEVYYDSETKEFYLQGSYIREKGEYEKTPIGDVTELFKRYNPVYKNEYLENGKLYRRIK